MYPSSNNNTTFFGNYYNDNNHSKALQDLYNGSSFLVPSPVEIFEDEAVFCEIFHQQQFVSNDNNHYSTITLDHEMPNTMEELFVTNDGDDDHLEPDNSSSRKIVSKRDRHSKINTARGPRDRRMRLSLDVAKKLFGLQDLLGFDKASKTVDWLLTKSRSAILDLLPNERDVSSSTSEGEVISGTGDPFMVMTGDDHQTTTTKAKSSCKKQKEKVAKVRKCADFHHPLAKASRDRARERARERTIEKRNNHHVGSQYSKSRPLEDVNRLGSWSTTLQENQYQTTALQLMNQGIVCDLMTTGMWTPSYNVNFLHNSVLTHEQQLNNLQMNVKAWEGYNN
ncbi:hypothetical protein R6Q57_001983 [Mikania cordata]